MNHTPLWALERVPFPALARAIETDILIVGGGITGVTAALLLRRAGYAVVLLDRQEIGGGETVHTTAHGTYVTDARLSELVKTFGRDHARAAWDAGQMGMEQIATLAREEAIDCDLRRVPGYLCAAVDAKDEAAKLHEEAVLASELGFDASFVEADPLWQRPAIRFSSQLRFHPLKFIRGLLIRFAQEGGQIFEHTNVEGFADDGRHATANGHTIGFSQLLVATHVPLQGIAGATTAALLQTKLAAYSTYAVAARIPAGRLPDALFWDTANPYTYVRSQPEAAGQSVILGGEDHKTGQVTETDGCYRSLEARLHTLYPEAEIARRWSGQVIETPDGLPYIGATAERQFVATGFAGNGMTFGVVAAVMLRDLLTGVRNPWKDLFDPGRKTLSSAWDYVKENLDYPYYLLRNFTAAAEAGTDDLEPGTGKIVRVNGKKTAAYRTPEGKLTLCSPVCPHLGCIVNWNAGEKTWDCPCHGSRFSPEGDLINGPAESGLGPQT